MERRGSLIAYQGKSCIPTLHPAAILRNINLRPLLISDLQLAKQKASGTIDFGKYVCIDERSKLDSVFHRISEVEELSVDLETSVIGDDPDFVHDHMLGTSFSWQEKTGLYIPLWENHKKIWDPATETYILNSYRELLTDPSKKKLVMHNGKFDYKFLKKVGVDLSRCVIKDGEIRTPFYFDTMLAHHLIWERPPHDLKHLARRFPDLASYEGELDTYKKANKTTDYGDIPMHIMYKYAAGDADATLRLYKIFSAELEQDPVRNHLFHSLIMPFAVALAETEYNGTKIDRDTISYLRVQLERRIEKRKGLIFKRSGKEFNINSIDQLGAVLYDDLNLSKNPSKTPTGKRKVDDEALSEIKHKHKIVRSILNYRGAMKEYKTYVLGLEKGLDESNRIHPNFKQHGTETGRLSCTKPNLQNIPRGNKMRSLFTAEAGCSLVGADFSQIEIRVLAALTRDPDLLRVFNEGRDIHTEVAKRVLHKQEVTKEERIIAKGINFGIMYGRGANSIAEELGIDRSVAETFLREYLKMYPGISAFQAQQKSIVHREKQVKTMFGRIRHLPEIDSEFEDEIASAERQALNSPIQGTAADCANLSAVKIYFILREIGLDAKLVLTIHDELVFEVKNADVPKVASLVYSIMKETAEEALNVPVDVDLYVYPKWVEPKEAEQRRYLASIGCKETLLEDIKNGIQS
jgi:DNA polymerase-1